MTKIYVGEKIQIHNPTVELLPFLLKVDPFFTVSSFRPSEKFIPRFQLCRKTLIPGLTKESLLEKSINELEKLHTAAKYKETQTLQMENTSSINLLQLKKEIAFRLIMECTLCRCHCKINRYNEKGRCGLDYKAFHAKLLAHVGEEGPINPTIVVNFYGCSWACVYCIQGHELKTSSNFSPLNVSDFWLEIKRLLQTGYPINTLEFAGGDPTLSMHWILEALSVAPDDFNLPIVWNCNTSATDDALNLLDGVVDVYLIDFRYGNDECAKRLSNVDNYWHDSTRTLETMINQNSRALVRILVLPNHVNCCHRKAIEWLTQYRDSIWVSILDQYVPEFNAKDFSDINRRPTAQEVEEVERLVQEYGLRDIKEHPEDFWE